MGYSLTRQQKREQAASEYKAERKSRKPTVTPSRTLTNATMRDNYVQPNWTPARDDADQHKQFHGGGYQPQIDRRSV